MSNMNFFVYGSLSSDGIHFSKFFKPENLQGSAAILGCCYRLQVGYPVACKNGTDLLPGELVSVEESDSLLLLMDEFHGYSRMNPEKSLYIREVTQIRRSDGSTVEGYCYYINPLKIPKTAKQVSNGDWLQDLKMNPPLTSDLTEREREYIRKLGNTSGRDIIPYQLDLYRLLTNRGLIIDKGRRLALTKLGQEVYRFLE